MRWCVNKKVLNETVDQLQELFASNGDRTNKLGNFGYAEALFQNSIDNLP
jgi:hypothetical protein